MVLLANLLQVMWIRHKEQEQERDHPGLLWGCCVPPWTKWLRIMQHSSLPRYLIKWQKSLYKDHHNHNQDHQRQPQQRKPQWRQPQQILDRVGLIDYWLVPPFCRKKRKERYIWKNPTVYSWFGHLLQVCLYLMLMTTTTKTITTKVTGIGATICTPW